jgi:hypothetical protein
MRRLLLAAAVAGAAVIGVAPGTASASHACAEGFEILCTALCPAPPKLCFHQ